MNTDTTKRYRLLKNLPNVKDGIFEYDKETGMYKSSYKDVYGEYTFYRENVLIDNPDWFEVLPVSEPVKERIIIVDIVFSQNNQFGNWYSFSTKSEIHPDKYLSIKQAIESCLNEPLPQPSAPEPSALPNKEWEIESFVSIHGEVLTLDEKKWKYRSETSSISDIDFLLRHYSIHSVRRLKDSVIFKIGDKVYYDEGGGSHANHWVIDHFYIRTDGVMLARGKDMEPVETIDKNCYLKHSPTPTEPVVEDKHDSCGICGSKLVYIRGKYPNCDKRPTCPTCTTERLEQINEISSKDYGKAYQSN